MNVWKEKFGTGARRAVAILCLVCLLTCFGTVRASAAGNARITVASCSAEQEASVSVAVRLDGNPGLWGLKLRIGYDASAMTLDAVDTGSLFSEDELTFSESLSKNPYVIVASRGKLEDLTGDGSLVTLKFFVKDGAEQKEYPVTVEIVQAVNVAGENVSIDAANGSVTVAKCLHERKQWITTEEAACEKAGVEVLTCKKCAATFETRSLSATGHQHTEVRDAVAATHTQAGYTGDTYCTDCGKLISQGHAIEKLTEEHVHTPELVGGQAATEEAAGWNDYYECDCGAFFEDENGNTPIENLTNWKALGGNGYIAKLVHGTDANNDHICDYCNKQVSECKDEDSDHICDICGKRISEEPEWPDWPFFPGREDLIPSDLIVIGNRAAEAGEENPNTGAEVPRIFSAIAVLAGAAFLLSKKR